MARPKYELYEAMTFKPKDGGYIYRAPKPTMFSERSFFLVTEGQKAEIMSVIKRGRPALDKALFAVELLLSIGALAAILRIFGSGHLLIALAAAMLPIIVFGNILIFRENARLKPALEGLQKTNERFSLREMFEPRKPPRKQTPNYRVRAIAGSLYFAFALYHLIAYHNPGRPALALDIWSILVAASFAWTCYYSYRAIIGIAPSGDTEPL